MSKNIYVTNHFKFIDNLIIKKRLEIVDLIKGVLKKITIKNILDVGTTRDKAYSSSNIIIKRLNIKCEYRSLSNQIILDNFFNLKINKSITGKFSQKEVDSYSSDVVISNATIEHVGNRTKQKKMIENIAKLTKKIFIISTPNKNFPLEFHTKIPIIHLFPERIYTFILRKIGLGFFANTNNLNLLSYKDLKTLGSSIKKNYYIKFFFINLFFIKSNIVMIGIKKNKNEKKIINNYTNL